MVQAASPYVGLLPAAGRGTRLAPLRYPKELLPIVYESVLADGAEARPRAVAEYALDAIAAAGARRALVIVAPWKLDVVNYLGDGSHFRLDIGYLYQEEARGLPYALDLAHPWTRGQHTVFAMPDTILAPGDALAELRGCYEEAGADLALAVFPTAEAHRLGPVLVDGDRVLQVFDKPAMPLAMNTWGAAIWGPAFSDLLHEEIAGTFPDDGEPVLGHYFNLAIEAGLTVVAREFPHGSFEDAGTRIGILRCLGADAAVRPMVRES